MAAMASPKSAHDEFL